MSRWNDSPEQKDGSFRQFRWWDRVGDTLNFVGDCFILGQYIHIMSPQSQIERILWPDSFRFSKFQDWTPKVRHFVEVSGFCWDVPLYICLVDSHIWRYFSQQSVLFVTARGER